MWTGRTGISRRIALAVALGELLADELLDMLLGGAWIGEQFGLRLAGGAQPAERDRDLAAGDADFLELVSRAADEFETTEHDGSPYVVQCGNKMLQRRGAERSGLAAAGTRLRTRGRLRLHRRELP